MCSSLLEIHFQKKYGLILPVKGCLVLACIKVTGSTVKSGKECSGSVGRMLDLVHL